MASDGLTLGDLSPLQCPPYELPRNQPLSQSSNHFLLPPPPPLGSDRFSSGVPLSNKSLPPPPSMDVDILAGSSAAMIDPTVFNRNSDVTTEITVADADSAKPVGSFEDLLTTALESLFFNSQVSNNAEARNDDLSSGVVKRTWSQLFPLLLSERNIRSLLHIPEGDAGDRLLQSMQLKRMNESEPLLTFNEFCLEFSERLTLVLENAVDDDSNVAMDDVIVVDEEIAPGDMAADAIAPSVRPPESQAQEVTSLVVVSTTLVTETPRSAVAAPSVETALTQYHGSSQSVEPPLSDSMHASHYDTLREIFTTIDKDNDGVITRRELIISLRKYPQLQSLFILSIPTDVIGHREVSQYNFNLLFDEMDVNNTSDISFDEFVLYFKSKLSHVAESWGASKSDATDAETSRGGIAALPSNEKAQLCLSPSAASVEFVPSVSTPSVLYHSSNTADQGDLNSLVADPNFWSNRQEILINAKTAELAKFANNLCVNDLVAPGSPYNKPLNKLYKSNASSTSTNFNNSPSNVHGSNKDKSINKFKDISPFMEFPRPTDLSSVAWNSGGLWDSVLANLTQVDDVIACNDHHDDDNIESLTSLVPASARLHDSEVAASSALPSLSTLAKSLSDQASTKKQLLNPDALVNAEIKKMAVNMTYNLKSSSSKSFFNDLQHRKDRIKILTKKRLLSQTRQNWLGTYEVKHIKEEEARRAAERRAIIEAGVLHLHAPARIIQKFFKSVMIYNKWKVASFMTYYSSVSYCMRQRNELLSYLINLEQKFIKNMYILKFYYKRPLKNKLRMFQHGTNPSKCIPLAHGSGGVESEAAASSVFETLNLKTIFNNVFDILAVHKKILESLVPRTEDWPAVKISDLFVSLTFIEDDILKYACGIDDAYATIDAACEPSVTQNVGAYSAVMSQSSEFGEFMNQQQLNHGGNINLKQLLFLPIEHTVIIYNLLKKYLVYNNNSTFVEYHNLSNSVAKLKVLVTKLNTSSKFARDRLEKLFSIDRKVIGIEDADDGGCGNNSMMLQGQVVCGGCPSVVLFSKEEGLTSSIAIPSTPQLTSSSIKDSPYVSGVAAEVGVCRGEGLTLVPSLAHLHRECVLEGVVHNITNDPTLYVFNDQQISKTLSMDAISIEATHHYGPTAGQPATLGTLVDVSNISYDQCYVYLFSDMLVVTEPGYMNVKKVKKIIMLDGMSVEVVDSHHHIDMMRFVFCLKYLNKPLFLFYVNNIHERKEWTDKINDCVCRYQWTWALIDWKTSEREYKNIKKYLYNNIGIDDDIGERALILQERQTQVTVACSSVVEETGEPINYDSSSDATEIITTTLDILEEKYMKLIHNINIGDEKLFDLLAGLLQFGHGMGSGQGVTAFQDLLLSRGDDEGASPASLTNAMLEYVTAALSDSIGISHLQVSNDGSLMNAGLSLSPVVHRNQDTLSQDAVSDGSEGDAGEALETIATAGAVSSASSPSSMTSNQSATVTVKASSSSSISVDPTSVIRSFYDKYGVLSVSRRGNSAITAVGENYIETLEQRDAFATESVNGLNKKLITLKIKLETLQDEIDLLRHRETFSGRYYTVNISSHSLHTRKLLFFYNNYIIYERKYAKNLHILVNRVMPLSRSVLSVSGSSLFQHLIVIFNNLPAISRFHEKIVVEVNGIWLRLIANALGEHSSSSPHPPMRASLSWIFSHHLSTLFMLYSEYSACFDVAVSTFKSQMNQPHFKEWLKRIKCNDECYGLDPITFLRLPFDYIINLFYLFYNIYCLILNNSSYNIAELGRFTKILSYLYLLKKNMLTNSKRLYDDYEMIKTIYNDIPGNYSSLLVGARLCLLTSSGMTYETRSLRASALHVFLFNDQLLLARVGSGGYKIFFKKISLINSKILSSHSEIKLLLLEKMEYDKIYQFLSNVYFLNHASTHEISLLASSVEVQSFVRGQTVFRAGDVGDCCYVVMGGTVQVYKKQRFSEESDDEEVTATLHPGGSFGELALIHDVLRDITVKVVDTADVVMLSRKCFNRIFGSYDGLLQRSNNQFYKKFQNAISPRAASPSSPKRDDFARSSSPFSLVSFDLNADAPSSSLAQPCHRVDSMTKFVLIDGNNDQHIFHTSSKDECVRYIELLTMALSRLKMCLPLDEGIPIDPMTSSTLEITHSKSSTSNNKTLEEEIDVLRSQEMNVSKRLDGYLDDFNTLRQAQWEVDASRVKAGLAVAPSVKVRVTGQWQSLVGDNIINIINNLIFKYDNTMMLLMQSQEIAWAWTLSKISKLITSAATMTEVRTVQSYNNLATSPGRPSPAPSSLVLSSTTTSSTTVAITTTATTSPPSAHCPATVGVDMASERLHNPCEQLQKMFEKSSENVRQKLNSLNSTVATLNRTFKHMRQSTQEQRENIKNEVTDEIEKIAQLEASVNGKESLIHELKCKVLSHEERVAELVKDLRLLEKRKQRVAIGVEDADVAADTSLITSLHSLSLQHNQASVTGAADGDSDALLEDMQEAVAKLMELRTRRNGESGRGEN